jgi:hypothetical protein
MATFIDRALVWLHDPGTLGALLRGAPATSYPHLERLVAAVFDPAGVTIDRIVGATVTNVAPMRALAATDRVELNWQQHQPSFQLADVRGTFTRSGTEVWADLYATVRLDLVAEVDPGGIESAVSSSIGNITSLADFQSRFRFLDLDDFLPGCGSPPSRNCASPPSTCSPRSGCASCRRSTRRTQPTRVL